MESFKANWETSLLLITTLTLPQCCIMTRKPLKFFFPFLLWPYFHCSKRLWKPKPIEGCLTNKDKSFKLGVERGIQVKRQLWCLESHVLTCVYADGGQYTRMSTRHRNSSIVAFTGKLSALLFSLSSFLSFLVVTSPKVAMKFWKGVGGFFLI